MRHRKGKLFAAKFAIRKAAVILFPSRLIGELIEVLRADITNTPLRDMTDEISQSQTLILIQIRIQILDVPFPVSGKKHSGTGAFVAQERTTKQQQEE